MTTREEAGPIRQDRNTTRPETEDVCCLLRRTRPPALMLVEDVDPTVPHPRFDCRRLLTLRYIHTVGTAAAQHSTVQHVQHSTTSILLRAGLTHEHPISLPRNACTSPVAISGSPSKRSGRQAASQPASLLTPQPTLFAKVGKAERGKNSNPPLPSPLTTLALPAAPQCHARRQRRQRRHPFVSPAGACHQNVICHWSLR